MPESKMTVRITLVPGKRLNLRGANPADLMFHFHCFNTEDPQDPSVGLINGELCIPGNLLRREVFDPVVNEARLQSYSRRLILLKLIALHTGIAID